MSPSSLHALVLLDHSPALEHERLAEALAAWNLGAIALIQGAPELRVEAACGMLTLRAVDAAVAPENVDRAAKRSVARFSTEAKWRRHTHHVDVTLAGATHTVEVCSWFTRALAAIAQGYGGVGVYWTPGEVAHDADFFIHAAEDDVPLMLWSGVEVKREESDPKRPMVFVSSAGLGQFGLPELRIAAPARRADEAIGYLLDLATHIVEGGAPLPEGMTRGLDGESISVKYEVPNSSAEKPLRVAIVPLPER